ncbi:Predicted oxidoreductase [Rhizobium tibeticum]|uniref:L-glyceraldehyde 3-phosphate reductase n=1 Tax=Rhizobium tibeticum TaxID=501024 RepID=A0A1H8V2D3_9HYPH|nr:aldo/keto reductase [Rhizobium tibeticum]SEI18266.1 L-glyceraldehyde 3-phosphate reductase [Rhizobium tibeticum]SEP09387.1 Predicted oxidoreductase [Rhizobium tibeticum]
MDYVKFGGTGLEVSKICLGCMTFGEPGRGNHSWTLGVEDSRALIRQALDLGINFLDTANTYSDGSSEEIVGRAIRDFSKRDDIVLATKVFNRMRPGPNGAGLSRKAIFDEIDHSLRRLGTDYVDLYQIHRFDHATPIEETLEALHDVVKAGKARYIGASSMYVWQFAKMLYTSRANGWTPFVSMQDHLNLLYREEEREMLPFCQDQKIAVIPWSPLARGRLTRAWDEKTVRSETDEFGKTLYKQAQDADRAIIGIVGKLAEKHGVSRAQIATAWILQKGPVTAPIIGASKANQLADAVAALSVKLTPEDVVALEEPYVPHRVEGFK